MQKQHNDRRYFDLFNICKKNHKEIHIGHGWSYIHGNCQVKLNDHETGPWQFSSLDQVLLLPDVIIFKWRD